jgi:TetR/AcrR family transcriptional regulator, cholesterol catabolism regulator
MADPTTISGSPGSRLQRSQDARRARILAAVVDVACVGGYDAIQLRLISDRTGISTDTIYRYYGSRDELIRAAVAQWVEREFIEPAWAWLEGRTPAEQVLSFNRHVWEVWERNPAMLETFVRAAMAEGDVPGGIARHTVEALVPLTEHALRDVDPAYRDDLLMTIEHFTHSAMTFVVRGRLPFDEVYPQLERTVRRLAQHPAMDGHRPKSWDWKPRPARTDRA